ncbi:haloacetate dehalogenase [Bradyrhizobium sp. LM2.7]
MSDLADLYPGFASQWINTSFGRIFARVGGHGPPLLLLHGFSETHVMWHRVAPQLADRFTLIIADLPGYGWSDMPESDALHMPYSKRAMAKAMVEVMEQLGHVHFLLAGHDRGGRVSYRLALDHPGRLSRLAVLDILPTYNYWERMNRAYALKIYHWTFLAQPYPLPETLISGNGEFFLRFKMASQTRSKTLDAIDDRALEHYIAPFRDPARVHAMCEDYRAGRPISTTISTRRISRPARRSRSRCWHCGAMPASRKPPLRRSISGSNGQPTSTACRWIPGTSSPKRIRT